VVRPQRRPQQFVRQMSLGIARNRDMVWLRPFQTCRCRKQGQPRPVLDAIQPLLLERRHQLPIPQHRRRRIAMERVKSENFHFRFHQRPPVSGQSGSYSSKHTAHVPYLRIVDL